MATMTSAKAKSVMAAAAAEYARQIDRGDVVAIEQAWRTVNDAAMHVSKREANSALKASGVRERIK